MERLNFGIITSTLHIGFSAGKLPNFWQKGHFSKARILKSKQLDVSTIISLERECKITYKVFLAQQTEMRGWSCWGMTFYWPGKKAEAKILHHFRTS